ncbi:MAG TPA: Sec-independent protein translocase protein TatB [Steroidobacteraceae bacterium]|nr:Sec-independent protein translocase protein TatB [Steroidobacteraceae bacterium]
MLDVGFSEILVIFVLALIVLGPEKLPKVAAQVGRWIGRARGMARQFREQLEEEVNLEQARKLQQAEPPPPITQRPSTPPPEPPKSYPDTYSHAHPTDAEGRPVPAASSPPEAPAADPRQQDWVGGVSGDPSAQSAADAARAQSHERGT